MSVCLVSPGIATSAGHDKIMDLARAAYPPDTPLFTLKLARAKGIGPRLGWRSLEMVKRALAATSSRPGPVGRLTTRMLEAGSVQARGSRRFSSLLTAPYRQELLRRAQVGPSSRVVSSHYLALIGRPPDWPATLLGPDILVQSAVAAIEEPRCALSPCRAYSDGLIRAGFRVSEILEVGPLLPASLHRARSARWARRQAVAGGEHDPEVLFAIGGSAPEAESVVALAKALTERRGPRLHVLVGDGRPHAVRIRARLEALRDGVRVYGGRPGATREDELAELRELMARPELTAWVTRPNEGSVLALALGFELFLLPPYQPHEKAASEVLETRGVRRAETLLDGAVPGRRLDDPAEGFVPVRSPELWLQEPELCRALGVRRS